MKILKNRIKRAFSRPCRELAARWPNRVTLDLYRRMNKVQLRCDELQVIVRCLTDRAPCRFLVFGLGRDSSFWARLNRGGKTVFIEDNREWLERITTDSPGLEAYLVDYGTRLTEWEELLDDPRRLEMRFPSAIETTAWDVILVDAPNGWPDTSPGRMKSIAATARLSGVGGDIFVHDCNRQVEQVYCDAFLKAENLAVEVGQLRYYRRRQEGMRVTP